MPINNQDAGYGLTPVSITIIQPAPVILYIYSMDWCWPQVSALHPLCSRCIHFFGFPALSLSGLHLCFIAL